MSRISENPLLDVQGLPPFPRIRAEHVVPAVEQLLAQARATVERLLARGGGYDWDNLGQPMEALDDRLDRAWSTVSHLHAVCDSPPLREAYAACLPRLSEYATGLGQDPRLYEAYLEIARGADGARLDGVRRRIVDNALRDFRLAGVTLAPQHKRRFRDISSRLAALCNRFEENVLDATQGWRRHLTDPAALRGLPESALARARAAAQREGLPGWLLTLEYPSYLPVITYAEDESLRREIYEAYTTRASDRGPQAGRWDNTALMEEIVALRHELVTLLGFGNFAQYSLAKKMARSTGEVTEFLEQLARRARPAAERELAELRQFAREHFGRRQLEAWDIPWYSEKLRQQRFSLSQEELRPWFPAPRVIAGMFEVVHRLYGLAVHRREGVDTWHPDVEFFEIRDLEGALRGRLYLDLYARPHKRGGAWMAECTVRRREGARVEVPVAFLVCNFSPPAQEQPSLLTHQEVCTLFHEFGHALHHLLTRVDYPSVAGIHGVPWDAVELPSQFMENWCWEREALACIASHHRTGEALPRPLYERLRAARTFQAGMQTLRQIEFALFDFRLHRDFDPARGARIQELLGEVRRQVAVVQPPEFNRFAHSFSHIFGGGYAAGYYSYKWAEVLSSDAYSCFEENGIFDRDTGLRFLHTILEQGGARDALELFVEFRGREPRIDALLRHSGVSDSLETAEDVA